MTWRSLRLKRVARVSYGLSQPPTLSEAGIPILRATNITQGRITRKGMIYALREDLPLDRAPLLRDGEILVVRSGAYTGDSALITKTWAGCAPGYDLRVSPISAHPPYIAYCLRSSYALRQMSLASARAAQPHLNAEDLNDMTIRIPSLPEQRRITDFLDAETAFLDQIQISRLQQKQMLIQRRWSLFQDFLDKVPKRLLPLRRLLHSVIDGPFGSAFSSADYVDDGAAVVRLGNIGFCEYRYEEQARIPVSVYNRFRKYKVIEGDILIAGLGDPRNHAGRACIAPDLGIAIVKGKCFRARINKAVTSAEFLVMILSSPLGADAFETRGSTRSMINLEIVRSATFPIPSYTDQLAIAQEVNRYWQLALTATDTCDRQIALIDERRQALITAAVTGQIDVTSSRRSGSNGGAIV